MHKFSGSGNPFFGKKHSDKTREIIKVKRALQIMQKRTEESKLKVSKSVEKSWAEGKHFITSEARKNMIQGILKARKFGANSHSWRGGVCKPNELFRRRSEYKKWRESVFVRDNFICQMCFVRGGRLNADHIKPFALFPELRLNLDNGRTLCEKCHQSTPTYGGKSQRIAHNFTDSELFGGLKMGLSF